MVFTNRRILIFINMVNMVNNEDCLLIYLEIENLFTIGIEVFRTKLKIDIL